MVRGPLPDLATPHPLSRFLPAIYQEPTPFLAAFLVAWDEILAPVLTVLDNVEAYLDPDLAPDDFVPWLTSWVGLDPEDLLPTKARAALRHGAAILGRRGTAAGLAAEVALAVEGSVQVVDGGGVAWSTTAGGALPGEDRAAVLVRVVGDPPAEAERRRLEALVRRIAPAHLPVRLEFVPPRGEQPSSPPPAGGGRPSDEGAADAAPSQGETDQ
jgi:phage tail-like protein